MKPKYTIEIYRDTAGEYRSRIRARNGKIVMDSGEGYRRAATARAAAWRMVQAFMDGDYTIEAAK